MLEHLEAVYEAVGGFTATFGNLTINPDAGSMPAYTITIVNQPV